ncbi:MAG: ABC transporter ATP-binding protein, partial [Rectinema sp.]|nr:ABC transporter ATP-binding protein [Rectinema sp.]
MAEFFDAEQITKGYDSQIARRILSYLKPYRTIAIVALLTLLLSTGGELVLPTLIRNAVDEALVRQWYGMDAAAISALPGNDQSVHVEIKGKFYVRAARLAGLSKKERDTLIGDGLLDANPSYLFNLASRKEEKMALASHYPSIIMGDKWGVVPVSILEAMPSEEAFIIKQDSQPILIRYALEIIMVLALVLLSSFFMTWFTNLIGTWIMKDMRLQVFRHIIGQSLGYLTRQPVGRLVTRITSDIETIAQFFSDVLSAFIKDATVMMGALFVMFLLNWKLALAVSITFPLVIAASTIARRKARDAFRTQRYWTSKVNSFLSEHISGIEVVKLFTQEGRAGRTFSEQNSQLLHANIQEMYVYAIFRPYVDLISTIASALSILAGAILFLNLEISIGTLIAFINLISILYSPIKDLSEKYILLQSAMASGERVFGLLDTNDPVPDTGKPEKIP